MSQVVAMNAPVVYPLWLIGGRTIRFKKLLSSPETDILNLPLA